MAAKMHPEMQVLADAKRALSVATNLEESRAAFANYVAVTHKPYPDDMKVEDLELPGPDAGQLIPVRWYRPANAPSPSPVVLYFHGGGFTLGDLESSDTQAWGIAQQTGVHVISVNYRLAPQHPFPAAPEDAFAVLQHVASEGATMGIDGSRVGTWGDSAGGCLSAVVCLMTRDRKGPPVTAQVVHTACLTDVLDSSSYHEHANSPGLDGPSMDGYWTNYLGDSRPSQEDYATPLKAKDLSGLPPALVHVAEIDPLADDGRRYCKRLQEAGVPAELRVAEGMIHGFLRARHIGPDSAAEFDIPCRFMAEKLGVA